MLDDRIARLLQDRKPGHSLPRDFYVDEEIFQADMKAQAKRDNVAGEKATLLSAQRVDTLGH